jgi:uncharacterized protein YndB with AHSA1/START domain
MTQPDTTVITLDEFLPHSPARVWRALTDQDALAAWFMPNDFAPVVGHTFHFHRTANCDLHVSDRIRCQVLEIRDEELLSYSWTDAQYAGELDSVVTWTLHAEGHGTRLFLEHRGFLPDDTIQQAVRTLMDGGWRVYIADRLARLLAATTSPATTEQPS